MKLKVFYFFFKFYLPFFFNSLLDLVPIILIPIFFLFEVIFFLFFLQLFFTILISIY